MKRISLIVASLFSILLSVAAFAEDAPAVPSGAAPGANPQAPGTTAMLVPFIAMFAIMYFLMIRPQQKRLKEQQSMLSALKEGDEVLTASGILGTVKSITDRMVTLEIDQNVSLKVLKSQVSQILKGGLPDKLA
jgi:preprotein translocase subunit YajC